MNKNEIFHILDIEETKDISKIRSAYRKVLKLTNPEDKPEEFKQLQTAYQEALAYAKEEEKAIEEKPSDSIGVWTSRLENIYKDLRKRVDIEEWKKVFSEEICLSLDTCFIVRDAILEFLMTHNHLPHNIWKEINYTFQIINDTELLLEKFPKDFIEYVNYSIKYASFLPYSLFSYTCDYEDANPDGYIDAYKQLWDMIAYKESTEAEEIEQLFRQMKGYGVYHPYEDVEQIKLLLWKELYKEAYEIATSLIQKHPEDAYIRHIYAETNFLCGNIEKAGEIWKELYEENKENITVALGLIRYYDSKQEYYLAKETVMNAMEIAGDIPELQTYLEHFNDKLVLQYEQALAEDKMIFGMSRDKIFFELGWCYWQQKKIDKGLELIEQRNKEDVSEYNFDKLYGCLLMGAGRYEKAIEHLELWYQYYLTNEDEEKVSKRKKGQILYSIGYCHEKLQQLESAIALYKKACEQVENTPDVFNYYMPLIYAYMQEKSYGKAVDLCDEIIEADSSYIPAYWVRQECCFYMENYQQVISDYEILSEAVPEYYKSYMYAIEVFLEVDAYEDAILILKRAKEQQVKFTPRMRLLEAKLILYTERKNKKSVNKAIQILSKLKLELQNLKNANLKETGDIWDIEDNSEIIYELGVLYKENRNYDEAFECFQEAIRQNPKRQQYHMGLGDWYYSMGRIEEALQEIVMAKEEYEDTSQYQYFMGICEEKLGNIDEAIKYYESGLAIEPRNTYAVALIIRYYIDRYLELPVKEHLDKIYYYLDDEHGFNSESAMLMAVRGYFNIILGFYEKAKDDLREASQIEENFEIWFQLAISNMYLNEFEKAIGCLANAREFWMDENCMVRCEKFRAVCYELAGNRNKAIQCLESIKDYLDLEYQRYLGELYIKNSSLYMAKSQYKIFGKFAVQRCNIIYDRLQNKKISNIKKAYIKSMIVMDQETVIGREAKVQYYKEMVLLFIAMKEYKLTIKALEWYFVYAYDKDEKIDMGTLLVFCYQQCGRNEEAEEYVKQVLGFWEERYTENEKYTFLQMNNVKCLVQIAAIYVVMKNEEKATEYLEYITNNKRCMGCRYFKCYRKSLVQAFLYEQQKEYGKALKAYEETLRINELCIEAMNGIERLKQKGMI